MIIEKIKARIIINSRGEKAIEIEVNNAYASAPSGASKGKNEVVAFPKEVEDVVKDFNSVKDKFLGLKIESFEDLDQVEEVFFSLGGFERFGGNTLVALEFAILKALAKHYRLPLFKVLNPEVKEVVPRPLGNVIGGGAHALWRGPDFQEFLILPKTKTVREAVFLNAKIHRELGQILKERDKGFLGAKNDEGAWVTTLKIEEILEILSEIKEKYNVKIGVDVAASQLYKNGKYILRKENKEFSREEWIEYIKELIETYGLYYIEDPLYEEDFEGFAEVNKTKALVVGDDLTVTNIKRVMKAYEKRSVKGVIIKVNQIGSVLKAYEVVEFCKKKGLVPIVSHRSGETEDNTIAHLAVAWEVPIIKTGVVQGERIAKLNELIRIEEWLEEYS